MQLVVLNVYMQNSFKYKVICISYLYKKSFYSFEKIIVKTTLIKIRSRNILASAQYIQNVSFIKLILKIIHYVNVNVMNLLEYIKTGFLKTSL